jgi:hypothetical protein
MGNINSVSPAKLASESYGSFLKELHENTDALDVTNLAKSVDRQFSLFLEDFMVNDEQFQKFTNKGKKICLAGLCFMHGSIPFDSKATSVSAMVESAKYSEVVLNYFNDDKPASDILSGYVLSMYAYNGSSFFVWNNSEWVPCSETDVTIDGFVKGSALSTEMKSYGLTDPLLSKGLTEFTQYLKDLSDAVKSFRDSDTYTSVMANLKNDVKKFNFKPELISCFSGPVNVEDGSQRKYKPGDWVSVKLPYDPSKTTTDLVSTFVNSFKCDSKVLATHLIRCGVSVVPTLTIVTGPKGSGKTTFLEVVRALYGPYACSVGDMDNKLARVCCLDDVSLLSEDFVKKHSCDHLVVACDSLECDDFYGDRRVKRLTFTDPIDEDDLLENVVTKLTTRKQLGSLLGWCLQNYDVSLFQSQPRSSGFPSSLLSLLGGDGVGYGRPNCPNCSGAGGMANLLKLLREDDMSDVKLGTKGTTTDDTPDEEPDNLAMSD